MAKKEQAPAYWAVIPASVRYDDRIPANAKLLYGEITALCNQSGYCWAKNEYFAQLFGWAAPTVTRLLSSLRDAGHLEVEMVTTATGSERRIFAGICTGGVRNFAERGVRKIVGGVSAKMITPPQYIVNNTQEYTPHTPHGGKRVQNGAQGGVQKSVHKDAPEWKPERFAGLWDFYPAKGRKNKQRAIAAWDKLKPDDVLIDRIARALTKLKATEEWQRGVGIPYVSTFLNGERWCDADELEAADSAEGEEVTFGWQT